MPGVQDNYSIDVTNRFGFADIAVDSDGSDDGIENVDPFAMINDLKRQAETVKKLPKQKVNKKKVVATPPPTQPEKKEPSDGEKKAVPSKRGERGGARGGRGRGDGRPRADRPPREQRQGTEVEGAPKDQREDRPRRGGRGGERGGGGGRGPRRDGEQRRTFDRKSGDPRSSVKGTEKRDGAGPGNWGTPEDDLKAQTETVEENAPKEEKPAEGKTEEKVEEAKKAEEEAKTMTLEEYRKQKKSVQRNPNARAAQKSSDSKKAASGAKEREKKGRAARVEAVDFVAAPLVQRGGPRGGGRGGGRRGDNRSRKEPQAALDLNGEEFPSLG